HREPGTSLLYSEKSQQWRATPMKWSAVFLIVCCAIPLFGQSEDEAKAKEQVTALEKAWNQAYKLKDTKALSKLLDPDLVLIEDDGAIRNREQFFASVKSSGSNEEQVAPESLTVHVFGNTAVAVGTFAAKGNKGGRVYLRRERFVDTWLKRGDNWV